MRSRDLTSDSARSNVRGRVTQRDEVRGRGLRFTAEALTDIVDISEGWASAAKCRGEHAALFFGPTRFEPKQERLDREAEAKAVCATCPVVTACREHALQSAELYGVWGGLGEADRRTLLADRGRVARAG